MAISLEEITKKIVELPRISGWRPFVCCSISINLERRTISNRLRTRRFARG